MGLKKEAMDIGAAIAGRALADGAGAVGDVFEVATSDFLCACSCHAAERSSTKSSPSSRPRPLDHP